MKAKRFVQWSIQNVSSYSYLIYRFIPTNNKFTRRSFHELFRTNEEGQVKPKIMNSMAFSLVWWYEWSINKMKQLHGRCGCQKNRKIMFALGHKFWTDKKLKYVIKIATQLNSDFKIHSQFRFELQVMLQKARSSKEHPSSLYPAHVRRRRRKFNFEGNEVYWEILQKL